MTWQSSNESVSTNQGTTQTSWEESEMSWDEMRGLNEEGANAGIPEERHWQGGLHQILPRLWQRWPTCQGQTIRLLMNEMCSVRVGDRPKRVGPVMEERCFFAPFSSSLMMAILPWLSQYTLVLTLPCARMTSSFSHRSSLPFFVINAMSSSSNPLFPLDSSTSEKLIGIPEFCRKEERGVSQIGRPCLSWSLQSSLLALCSYHQQLSNDEKVPGDDGVRNVRHSKVRILL